MNHTRRAAALLARALAGSGWGVLQVDLFGCGDSDGEFRDASWKTWVDDLITAFDWLQERVGGRVGLVGIRLGDYSLWILRAVLGEISIESSSGTRS